MGYPFSKRKRLSSFVRFERVCEPFVSTVEMAAVLCVEFCLSSMLYDRVPVSPLVVVGVSGRLERDIGQS